MTVADAPPNVARHRIRVDGVVQGVGFRPFVHGLATELGLAGLVGNDAAGVFIEVEGRSTALDHFAARLVGEAPPLSRIHRVTNEAVPVRGDDRFEIVESSPTDGPRTLVPPDVATCDDCLAELADPLDRRYRYPFVNCTNCGPRFTIIRDLPYDRPATTMAGFELCPECADEYADPTDRRYHAQPVACPACGPRLVFEGEGEHLTGTDEVIAAVHRTIAAGGVVAIKGLGGYHLACDATDPRAIALLRSRKGRVDKPFAVMAADLDAVASFADPTAAEIEALRSPARPIVLLRRRSGGSVLGDGIAPGNPLVGVMLPYTPLHHLLFAAVPGTDHTPPPVLVMTSGNLANEPICVDDDDARTRLAGIADAFCIHDRPIEVPCDDSVVRVVDGVAQPIRRSRGYAPVPVALPFDVVPVLGVGGELKNTCCVATGRHAWVGQHVGDMENLATLSAFDASVRAFTTMYRVDPAVVGVDRHPGYLTRRWASERATASPSTVVVEVQHHHAHVVAAMVEHGLGRDAEVLGFSFDGTGYGEAADGTTEIWGGEVLRAGYAGFERIGHLAPMPLPGGDEAVRNPCRMALAALVHLGLPVDTSLPAVAACDEVERRVVARQVARDVGCVPTTSFGRLFDVVSSLLGVRHRVTYEAQAAIELEHLAERGDPAACRLAFDVVDGVIDPGPVLAGVVDGLRAGAEPADLAAAFHHAVADAVGRLADRHADGRPVVLTGGVFQNALLVRLVRDRLDGHEVLTHRLVPTNDGGLSLGQAVVAAVVSADAAAAAERSP